MAAVDPRAGVPASAQLVNEPLAGRERSYYDLATADDAVGWRARSRIVLTPVAAPSILGLFGFAIATMMVGAWQAGWYGSPVTPGTLWPLALFAGGILQLIAAVYCFRARDGVALAVHGVWGSFWLAWAVMQLLVVTHVMTPIAKGSVNGAFAFWFIALAVVTISATLASAGQSLGTFFTLGALSAGSSLTAAGFWSGSAGVVDAGGWLFVISAALAWLTATAMMMEHAYGRTIIPLGKWSKAANVPGRQPTMPIGYSEGMPGARVGQ